MHYSTETTRIASIDFERYGEFWDLLVPITHSYVAGGFINHNSGKDFIGGRIGLWWIRYWQARGEDAKVVITGPTGRQVEDVVWQNLRSAYVNNGGELSFGGRLYEIPYLRWSEETFIVAFSTDRDYQLQGYHSPHLLVIVTEAHGMAQNHVDALHRLNPQRLLLTGNPISEVGEFYDAHHSKRDRWNVIEIDAYDTPNVIEGKVVIPGLVTREDIEQHRLNWGEDDPRFLITVMNKWVAGINNLTVIPRPLAEDTYQNWRERKYAAGEIEVVGVDVARNGLDSTVVASRKGRVVTYPWRYLGNDTMVIADWVHFYLVDHPQAHCVVDGVGVGAGVVDRLRRLGHGVFDFQSGQNADDSLHYYNKISEVWWRLREAMIRGLSVEPQEDLIEQLAGRKYKIMTDKRIALQPKDEMRKEGRKSPDDADALALTFAIAYNMEDLQRGPLSDADRQVWREVQPHEEHRTLVFSTASEMRAALQGAGTIPRSNGRWSRFGASRTAGHFSRRRPDERS